MDMTKAVIRLYRLKNRMYSAILKNREGLIEDVIVDILSSLGLIIIIYFKLLL